jgi:hypothetical protein
LDFWQQLAERNGPWAIFLLIVLLFLWKGLLPFVQKRIEASDAVQRELITASRDALRENIVAARDARKEDQTQFLQALAARDRVQAEQTQALRELMEEIRGNRNR